MTPGVVERASEYESLLAEAVDVASIVSDVERQEAGEEVLAMARSYLTDGRYFLDENDPVRALAAFSYGHGWLDAGARLGVVDVPVDGDLFAM